MTATPPAQSHRGATLTAAVLVLCGLAVVFARHTDGTVAAWIDRYVSLNGLPTRVQMFLDEVLLVPLGSVVVVVVRLTLGVRMLGPFRPILIAIAFQHTGVVLGTSFMAAVLTVVLLIRPRLGGGWLPYFGRLSVLLAIVVAIELAVLMIGAGIGERRMVQAAFFPIVVLCLTADGFARALTREGFRGATERAATTVLVAAVITELAQLGPLRDFLFEHPEAVLLEIAAILMVSVHMNWGLLEPWLGDAGGDTE